MKEITLKDNQSGLLSNLLMVELGCPMQTVRPNLFATNNMG